ncbi:divergent polysaccharide deacetylase family protein [Jannaschia donghaensis]|uniref:Divergent polysaccharide deacetylase n=1 Tax=Jannaschia donghaensis TaxID=420998 RepID=A0A0M6YMX2_9RHOB|nr:divergent polysaccharide deacetylase family protein [Jannaschia donghaensis]CTQ50587.1 Divergent polysaccharide deacetylase [Jannaschia donghaensis]
MIKGILLGSASALALSALFFVSVILIAPPPQSPTRPAASLPDAPTLRDQAESTPRVPERPVRDDAVVAEAPAVPTGDATPGVEVPAGSQFNRPPEDRAARTPGVEAAPRPLAVTEGLRAGTTPTDAPAPQTTSATQPTPGIIAGFGAAPQVGDAPAVPRPTDELAPRTFGEVNMAAESAAAPADVEAPEAQPVPVPVIETAEAEGEPEPAAVVGPYVSETEAAPSAPSTPDGEIELAQAETSQDVAPAEPAQDDRDAEPQITVVETPLVVPRAETPQDDAEPDNTVMPRRLILDSERQEDDADADVVTVAPPPPKGALDLQAANFENPNDLPLMSIVLIDDPAFDVDRESLTAFDFPVTFAIDPTRPDAAEVAAVYRAAGHEVVALADIFPQGATPQDIEVAASAMRRALPQAVGLLDRASGGVAGDRAALDALLPALEEAGMGLLAHPAGLNTGVTTARREGVPATTLYRVLDDDAERAPVIVRYLDRATFEAAQDGTTVVLGRATSQTVTAIYSWRLGNRAEQVAAAPLSAVLKAAGEAEP